jgi:hypothetical protein
MNSLKLIVITIALASNFHSIIVSGNEILKNENQDFDPSFGKELTKLNPGEPFLDEVDAGK